MLKSYFFIPGNHKKLHKKLAAIKADILIVDLEDSISESELDVILENLAQVKNKRDIFLRPKLFNTSNPTEDLLVKLIDLGFTNFLIPKYKGIDDIRVIENALGSRINSFFKFILLIENPEALFSLMETVRMTTLNIVGLAFGSQDYCLASCMAHKYELLKFPRFMISGIAKSFKLTCIDIACMELEKKDTFIYELEEAELMGYDAKFIIHPDQLDILANYKKYSNKEIQEANAVMNKYIKLGSPAVFVYNGKAIEPPHIENYSRIIKYAKEYGSK